MPKYAKSHPALRKKHFGGIYFYAVISQIQHRAVFYGHKIVAEKVVASLVIWANFRHLKGTYGKVPRILAVVCFT